MEGETGVVMSAAKSPVSPHGSPWARQLFEYVIVRLRIQKDDLHPVKKYRLHSHSPFIRKGAQEQENSKWQTIYCEK